MASRTIRSIVRRLRSALVVISPATTTRSVVTSVSQATRLVVSALKQWSRIVSLIWSATLSGWPMETDSLVNKYRSALTVGVLGWQIAEVSDKVTTVEYSRTESAWLATKKRKIGELERR